jgi:hypothetical protein
MKAYILSVIFSADPVKKKPYLLTASHDELIPLIQIENPKYLYKEIFYQLKAMFIQDSIKIESDCSYNFLSIQQEMSINYAKKHYDFITDDDLIITYGGMLLKYKCLDNFQWTEYSLKTQHNGFSSDINLNLLLDYVIQRSNI